MDSNHKMTFEQLEAEIDRLNAAIAAANEREATAKAQTPQTPATKKINALQTFSQILDPVERGKYYLANEAAILACL